MAAASPGERQAVRSPIIPAGRRLFFVFARARRCDHPASWFNEVSIENQYVSFNEPAIVGTGAKPEKLGDPGYPEDHFPTEHHLVCGGIAFSSDISCREAQSCFRQGSVDAGRARAAIRPHRWLCTTARMGCRSHVGRRCPDCTGAGHHRVGLTTGPRPAQ